MIDLTRDVPITCHHVDDVFAPHLREMSWRAGRNNESYGGVEPWRTCSYCGSMHPLDLLGFMLRGEISNLGDADWKYGWPHKFYLDVPNPHAGKLASSGSFGGGAGYTLEQMQREYPGYINWRGSAHEGWKADVTPTPAPASMHGKFYSVHLKDLSEEEFGALQVALAARSGISFERQGEKLLYRAGP